MSNLFKYKIPLDAENAELEKRSPPPPKKISQLAFLLVCTVTTTTFSAIVTVLNYCFPGSLDGTYLKLFF